MQPALRCPLCRLLCCGITHSPVSGTLPPSLPTEAGTLANPLLACLLDALGEPGAAVQAAAATALGLAGSHLSPGLDPALLHQLLRALSNPLCLGRPELCRALAWLEGGRVLGLLASSCQQLLAAASEVLGSTAGKHKLSRGRHPAMLPTCSPC